HRGRRHRDPRSAQLGRRLGGESEAIPADRAILTHIPRSPIMQPAAPVPNRRDLPAATPAGTCTAFLHAQEATADEAPRDALLERAADGTPHKGKVLLAVQAHSDDIPLMAGGVVAKLVKEGYTGYLLRATNDDMGDAPGLGTVGSIG